MKMGKSLIMFNTDEKDTFSHEYYPVAEISEPVKERMEELEEYYTQAAGGKDLPLDRPLTGNFFNRFVKRTVRKLTRGTFTEYVEDAREDNGLRAALAFNAGSYLQKGSGLYDDTFLRLSDKIGSITERIDRAGRLLNGTGDVKMALDNERNIISEAVEEVEKAGLAEFREISPDEDGEKFLFDDKQFDSDLRTLNLKYELKPDKYAETEKRGFFKKLIRKLTGFYVDPVVEDQTFYNAVNTRTMNSISDYIHMDMSYDRERINRLEYQVKMLEQRACELEEKIYEREN
ncbi:MAG: hypothetical protein IJM62_03720 [Lachnospiraceae bacterium]|nr:hypothetical protein [Lachnospiraceae bacterium]